MTKPLVPVSRTAYVLGTAAIMAGERVADNGDVTGTMPPDVAARKVIDAAAPEIQRATARHFAELRTGGWSLFFMALWLPTLAAVLIEVAVNGSTMMRVLSALTIVGLTLSIMLMRRSQRQSKRRAEHLLSRADGDNWRTNGWAPGEREAVRVLITEGLRLPWPLPAPTTTADGVRNLTAMLRIAEQRATASESQIGKIRIVLDEPRGMSTGAQLAEIRAIVDAWRTRAGAYDDDAELIRSGLVELVTLVEPDSITSLQIAMTADGAPRDVDPGHVVEIIDDRDGTVLGTIVGADASELSTDTVGISFRNTGRNVDPDGPDGAPIDMPDGRRMVGFPAALNVKVDTVSPDASADDPHEHPWAPGELSGELPPRADVDAEIADADRRRADVADGIRDGIAGLGDDADPVRASRVLGLVDAWQNERAGRPLDLGDADRLRGDRDRLDGDRDRLDGDAARLGFGSGLPLSVVAYDEGRRLDQYDGFGAPISSPAPEPDRSAPAAESTSSGDTSTSTSSETGSPGPSD